MRQWFASPKDGVNGQILMNFIPAPEGHPRGAAAGGTANALHIHAWTETWRMVSAQRRQHFAPGTLCWKQQIISYVSSKTQARAPAQEDALLPLLTPLPGRKGSRHNILGCRLEGRQTGHQQIGLCQPRHKTFSTRGTWHSLMKSASEGLRTECLSDKTAPSFC